MSDEPVKPGEAVITSGGDRIFPKGLAIGTVASVEPGKDLFLNIRVIPSARLDRLEEVLVITKIQDKLPDTTDLGPIRASDILSQRLPGVPDTAVDAAGKLAMQPGIAQCTFREARRPVRRFDDESQPDCRCGEYRATSHCWHSGSETGCIRNRRQSLPTESRARRETSQSSHGGRRPSDSASEEANACAHACR